MKKEYLGFVPEASSDRIVTNYYSIGNDLLSIFEELKTIANDYNGDVVEFDDIIFYEIKEINVKLNIVIED